MLIHYSVIAMAASLDPFDPFETIRRYARLAPHVGTATLEFGGETLSGTAEFLLPASGQALVAFRPDAKLTSQDFGRDLLIEGTTSDGDFRLVAPHVYVRTPVTDDSGHGCSLVSPVNAPATIWYRHGGVATRAIALLNHFDYEYGDAIEMDGSGFTRIGTPLALDTGDRRITFRHRPDYGHLSAMVRAGILRSASLVDVVFDIDADESDETVSAFAYDVSELCTFAAGTAVSVAALSLVDANGRVVRRVVPQPVGSRYRATEIVDDFALPDFFSATFVEYRRMKQIHTPWRRLASYCGTLEDSPYLEQKFASLMMALEYFMRNSLIEGGQTESRVAGLDFLQLIGATRKDLGWQVPKHYVARHTVRLLRNAVIHGGELPTKDSSEFRLLFDKWRLFFFRRVLMRLGYRGRVVSPHRGWAARSRVDDFSEEHNSFTTASADDAHPWTTAVRKLRDAQLKADEAQTG